MKMEIVFKDGKVFDVAQTPTEGKLFEVNPLGIDRIKFEKPISNPQQERTRQIIQEAFAEVDKHPEKYVSAFYTLMPKKKWNGGKTAKKLEAYAEDLGGQMADRVEQALEWAQRIFNGESWEAICNNADTANWYRLIICKNDDYQLVGGSRSRDDRIPASDIYNLDYDSNLRIYATVPLVVLRKK